MFRYDQKVPSTHTLQRCLCQVVGCDSSGKGERNAWATLTGNNLKAHPALSHLSPIPNILFFHVYSFNPFLPLTLANI